ncbi:MAG: DUF4838 domain-containing protein [Clostridia bacterium]|nr:DUF4838 domain-containing protein [Clostridia bacterium]
MKNFKLKIVSLALCAISCLVLAMATFTKTVKSADAESSVEITEMHTLEGFTIGETASVRRVEPMGIRFTTTVNAETKTQIINLLGGNESVVQFGTLIIPTDMLGDGELTHDTPSVAVAVPTSWNSDTVYTAVLGGPDGANLGESYYDRPISARSFAVNTETGVVYYTENTANRSIGFVAYMAQQAGDDTEYVTTVANAATKELVFNENVSIHNKEDGDATIVSNKYDKSSANVFAFKVGGIVVEDATVSYTSSNESVIAIDENGALVAVGEGVSTITGTITLADGLIDSLSKSLSTTEYAPSSTYKILVPASADSYETQAANKLQSIIKEATGVNLAIVTESGSETTAEKYISIGDTALAKDSCSVEDLTKDTASRVLTVDNTVFVRGVTKRATLYGVQRLLKETVGYEYYMDNTYSVNKKSEFVITDKDYVSNIDEVTQIGGTHDSIVSAEHGSIGYSSFLIPIGTTDEEDATGTQRYKGAAHNSILFFNDGVEDSSLYSLSSESYKKWYATNSNNYYLTNKSGIASTLSGAGKTELCYTAHGDSDVRSAMIEKLATEMFRKMRAQNGALEEFLNYDRIAFSHADQQSWCECSSCNDEGNPSDNMLHFILDVAANLKEKLLNVGDARANTFKICTLFYNETNLYAKNTANYQSAVDEYMQHVELWFAETRADYHVALNDADSTWNTTAKTNFDSWTALAEAKGADVLWWGYYANTKSMFIPYDSIDALRANYALAYKAGVDYMFNQGLQYRTNWMRLKQYLMSELNWNATPETTVWDGWIDDFFTASYGQGASAMYSYFEAWKTWAEANADDFANTSGYGGSGISKLLSEVADTSDTTFATLKGWLDLCNQALAALDVNDSKYQTYYNNIVLERLTPLYLIMHLYGFDYEISTSDNPYEAITSYTVKSSDYILPYAQDFLDGVELWGITQDGEMSSLDTFKSALEEAVSGITEYDDNNRQIVVSSTSITLTNANILAGESYTATLSGATAVTASTVTVSEDGGSVTIALDTAPAVGVSYDVVLRSSSKVITFTDVFFVTGTISSATELLALCGSDKDGYYVLTSDITEKVTMTLQTSGVFKGTLDGNGYSITGQVGTKTSGFFYQMNGATVKNIKLDAIRANAAHPVFTANATDTTFENVTLIFTGGGAKLLVTNEDNVTYKNVTVYTTADVSTVPYGVTIVAGTEVQTGITFFVVDGQTELWLKDENLAKGTYQVNVDGEVKEYTSFTAGRLKVNLGHIATGETIELSCSNGENNYVYNVMCVAKITEGSVNGEALDEFDGNESTLGFANGTYVQQMVTETITQDWWQTTNYPDEVVDSNGKTREQLSAVIVMPDGKDWVSVDISVSAYVGTANLFHAWGTVDGSLTAFGEVGATTETTTAGLQAQFLDKYGFKVSSLSANTVYKMQLKKDETEFFKLANVIREGMTVYFANVTYGTGDLPTPNTPPNVTMGDNKEYSIYEGDETALGFADGTMVFNLVNATPDDIYGDGWAKRLIFGASTTQDYITFEFVAKEDVENSNVFHVWGANGSPSIGTVSATTGLGGDWAIILDEYGFGITSIKAGKHYFASIACAGLANVQVGALDANEIYVANVTEHNGDLPTAVQPIVYAYDNATVPVYEGDETALGFEDGTLVFTSTAGAATWNENAIKFYTDSASNCVEIDFVLDKALAANCNQFMIWSSVASGATFIHNGNVVVSETSIDIEIFDADGNVATSFEANKKYTLKIYHEGSTYVTIALVGDTQSGTTIYYGNYEDTNDVYVGVPENVVTDASDVTLPKYTGDQTTYGFSAEDYVFEATMTDAWNDSVIIPVDSTNYDYMDVEFVVTSGEWYFNAWVVNADRMLDGSYLVAENASNSTYGSGYAVYNDNTETTDVVDGKTRIQVLDVDRNVVTGVRTVGTRYILRVYTNDESLTKVQLGQANTTILFANVTYGIEETITAGGTNTTCVTVYDGDVTALGFADGAKVYEYVGTDDVADKAAFRVDNTYDYVEVQFVIASGDGYFFGYALNGGSYLNDGSSYVIDPSNLRLASGATMDRTIQVFDADGNAVSTLLSTNTFYTLRVYTTGMDQFMIAKAGSTIYLANVTHGNDSASTITKPENVVTDGSGAELAQYAGNNTDIGFDDDDYVFEQVTTTDSWASRAHIGNNSTADFLVFEFSITNPSNMTIWFTRNGNVVAGYSNIVTSSASVAANESAARTIYVFNADGSGVSSIVANTKYQMWIYLGGDDSFHGVAIGNSSATIYYANVRYVYGTGENIFRQADANNLLAEYTGDVTSVGFEEGTFVQTLTGTSDIWTEDIYANRARLTASGTQDYISFDFVVQNEISGSNIFYLWAASGNGPVAKDGTSSAFTTQIVDENWFAVTTIEAGKRYTFIIYESGATYYGIGAYCNNTIYFGNVTYGTGELEEPYELLNNATTYEGDVTALGFAEGEYVQQQVIEATDNVWDGTRQAKATDIVAPEGQYVSIMFSLNVDFTSTDGNLFFVWCRLGETWPTNFYVSLTASANARILGTNGEVVTDTLKANTVYMLELYADGVDKYQLANINTKAITVYFATKSVKTYSTSIASSPVTGSRDGAVTVHYGTEELGFDRNEVVMRLETETVSNVWSDTQTTSGVGRASWLIKVASEAGKVVKIRFALSQDFTATGMLFYVWAYSDNDGTCPANGSVTLSGSSAMTASITDEAGNAVTELKAYQVYELSLYCDTAIKYDIGNFVTDGMITYVSSTVTYEDYVA